MGMIITWLIIIFTAGTSLIAFNRSDIFDHLKFNPYLLRHSRQWHRFFTYGLLHADWLHLIMNMFVLYSFGENVEFFMRYTFGPVGRIYYVLLYVIGIIVSVIPSYFKHRNHEWYNAVGASGAVSAVVFSSIIFWPSSKIIFLFIPYPIPASVFGILYLVFSAYMAKRASDNIGHDAHFWGALFGALFTIMLKPALAQSFFFQLINIF